jgi:hypothetical protein
MIDFLCMLFMPDGFKHQPQCITCKTGKESRRKQGKLNLYNV